MKFDLRKVPGYVTVTTQMSADYPEPPLTHVCIHRQGYSHTYVSLDVTHPVERLSTLWVDLYSSVLLVVCNQKRASLIRARAGWTRSFPTDGAILLGSLPARERVCGDQSGLAERESWVAAGGRRGRAQEHPGQGP